LKDFGHAKVEKNLTGFTSLFGFRIIIFCKELLILPVNNSYYACIITTHVDGHSVGFFA
jgi:hypothetical protein